ncbi:hypothetical protein [Rickettsiella endosymbiont of Rhagonycha lignosa]|uniref:hypothetical protein n=1 Tax=Rickettsiella endosymbiont of Rhagonycha lignosa TaxID=3077937 RepID=UPI00313E332E
MPLPIEIQIALKNYDQRKGFLRYLFGDHPSIKALRRLEPGDQNNIFKIYQCFHENFPKKHQESHVVYQALVRNIKGDSLPENAIPNARARYFKSVTEILDFFIQIGLVTQNTSDLVRKHIRGPARNFLCSIEFLNRAGLLNQKNLDAIGVAEHSSDFFLIFNLLAKNPISWPFTQEKFDSLKSNTSLWTLFSILSVIRQSRLITSENFDRLLQLRTENNFLYTSHACQIIWGRIPGHLLTQVVFEQLIVFSHGENPEQQIEQYVNRLLNRNQNTPAINGDQSTHYASVHQSVSDSAKKLFNRYGQMIERDRLENTQQMIRDYVDQLADNSEKNKAAKRCIRSIANHSFTDPDSGLTTQQLVALVFLAMHDAGQRVGSLLDAREQFVEGLYEIQRGYNLSETGLDNGIPDKPICAGGTFNKLIEKLEGVHPDVRVLHITPAIASLKLPVVVHEVAVDYLSGLTKPHTVEALCRFTQLIDQIKQDKCVDVIWDKIKTKITDRMFDEFGSLYNNKADPRFIDLVDNGQYIKLKDLSRFQKQISVSSGYKEYCRQILHSTKFFPKQETALLDKSAMYTQESLRL